MEILLLDSQQLLVCYIDSAASESWAHEFGRIVPRRRNNCVSVIFLINYWLKKILILYFSTGEQLIKNRMFLVTPVKTDDLEVTVPKHKDNF